MRKFVFVFIMLMFFALPALAFDSVDVVNNQISAGTKVYNGDFDILVLDIVIPSNGGEEDVLNALTINNTRDANNVDIEKVILWEDNGDDVWQGYMVDTVIAEGVRVDTRRWQFTELTTVIPVSGLHIYISVETKDSVTTDRKIQFEIEKLSDSNDVGSFNSNDKGVFVVSDNDGPTNESIVSNQLYTLEDRAGDILAPKVNLTNIVDGGSYDSNDLISIEGVAKDRMQGSPKWLRVSVVPTGNAAVWQEANALTTNYETWSYVIPSLAIGDYDVQVSSSDWDYNTSISDIITITLNESAVEPDPEPEPEPEPELPLVDPGEWVGTLIKTESSPRVYLLKDNMRYWFYNEAIFYQYYSDFSTVELISNEEMLGYVEGKDMPMKAGSLIKRIISNKVYETGDDWQMRLLQDEEEAINLYGEDWANSINLIPDRYFNYYNEVTNL